MICLLRSQKEIVFIENYSCKHGKGIWIKRTLLWLHRLQTTQWALAVGTYFFSTDKWHIIHFTNTWYISFPFYSNQNQNDEMSNWQWMICCVHRGSNSKLDQKLLRTDLDWDLWFKTGLETHICHHTFLSDDCSDLN